MAVQIERGVPVPKRGRPQKYPFRTMSVSDSFWAPVQPAALQACARRAAVPGVKFKTRRETRDGQPGARCWRMA